MDKILTRNLENNSTLHHIWYCVMKFLIEDTVSSSRLIDSVIASQITKMNAIKYIKTLIKADDQKVGNHIIESAEKRVSVSTSSVMNKRILSNQFLDSNN